MRGADELDGRQRARGDSATTSSPERCGGELAGAVGPATCGEVDVHALTQRTAPAAIAATQRVGRGHEGGVRRG